MNGSTLKDDNLGKRLSEVVDALTWLSIETKCSANGSPSQPLPNMLIVLIGNPHIILNAKVHIACQHLKFALYQKESRLP